MKRKTEKNGQKRKHGRGAFSLMEHGRIEIISRGREKELLLTGILRILLYSDTEMLFLSKDGRLLIKGQGLDCITYQSGALGLLGRVSMLSFEEVGK